MDLKRLNARNNPCAICQKPVYRRGSTYCSSDCAKVGRINRKCPTCDRWITKEKRIYCDPVCYVNRPSRKVSVSKGKNLPVELNKCLICDRRVNRFGNKYCSRTCNGLAQRKGVESSRSVEVSEVRFCLNCQKPVPKNLKSFCSRSCSGKYRLFVVNSDPGNVLKAAKKRTKPPESYRLKTCENPTCDRGIAGQPREFRQKGHRKKAKYCSTSCSASVRPNGRWNFQRQRLPEL